MIKPISNISNNQYYKKEVAFKSSLNRLQDGIDSDVKKNIESKNVLSCYAALILTILAVGATVATAIRAGKEKCAKQAIENVIPNDTLSSTKSHLNILK